MSKAKEKKPKNPQAEKKKAIIFFVLLIIAAAYGAFMLGIFDSAKPKRSSSRANVSASQSQGNSSQVNIPPGGQFIPSNDPNKPSKVVTNVPPAPRVVAAKKLKDVVTDYVDASKDKQAAVRGIQFTAQLPGVNKEFDVQVKKTEIAKLKFEEAEWAQKLAQLNADDVDGYISSEPSMVGATIDTYSDAIENGLSVETTEKEFEGPKKTAFSLEAVTSGPGGLIAYLRAGDKEFTVKDKSVIYGRYTVLVKDIDDVSICEESECVSIY